MVSMSFAIFGVGLRSLSSVMWGPSPRRSLLRVCDGDVVLDRQLADPARYRHPDVYLSKIVFLQHVKLVTAWSQLRVLIVFFNTTEVPACGGGVASNVLSVVQASPFGSRMGVKRWYSVTPPASSLARMALARALRLGLGGKRP